MLKEKIRLIPRYNWDYGFTDFISALTCIFARDEGNMEALEKVFGYRPVYTTSGRASLYVILLSLDLPDGANVGVPLFCCSVVFDAIRRAGLTPRFIDVNTDDYCISPQDLDNKKEELAAVIAVHMFGNPADMDSICSISGKMPVIEDCAQSLFSKYKEQNTGFLSNASFFSFRSGKYVSAGEGSAIFTADERLHRSIENLVESLDRPSMTQEMVHCLSTYVKSTLYKRPWYGTLGFPVGTTLDKRLNLTAKDGFKPARIKRCDHKIINQRIENFIEKINRQRRNSLYLLENLTLKDVVLPHEKPDCWSNYSQFAIRFRTTEERDFMSTYLFERGIDTAKYMDEIIEIAKMRYDYQGDCPNAERCSKTALVIPNHYTLSAEDIDYIVECVNDAGRHLSV